MPSPQLGVWPNPKTRGWNARPLPSDQIRAVVGELYESGWGVDKIYAHLRRYFPDDYPAKGAVYELVHEMFPERFDRQPVLPEVWQKVLELRAKGWGAKRIWNYLNSSPDWQHIPHLHPVSTWVSWLQPHEPGQRRLLTWRERKVLRGIAQGLNNDQLAEANGLGLKSVENQINTLYSKLDFPLEGHSRVLTVLWVQSHPEEMADDEDDFLHTEL